MHIAYSGPTPPPKHLSQMKVRDELPSHAAQRACVCIPAHSPSLMDSGSGEYNVEWWMYSDARRCKIVKFPGSGGKGERQHF